ncbi:MAG: porin [Burkholderiaceae bacterium]|nr:porin [Burkholderiaceae bacterium]
MQAQSSVTLYGRAEATVEFGRKNEFSSTSTVGNVTTRNTTFQNSNLLGLSAAEITGLAGAFNAGAIGLAATPQQTGVSKPSFALQDGNSLGDGSSRFGLRGTEDLGGGLSALFQLEAGVNIDDGSSGNGGGNLFSRTAIVGLKGGFGEVTAGRQVNPAFKVQGAGQAMGAMNGITDAGAIVIPAAGGVRSSNSVRYATPDFGGFTAEVLLAAPEARGTTTSGANAVESKSNMGSSLALNYNAGPLYVGVGYDQRKVGLRTSNFTTGAFVSDIGADRKTWVLSTAYDLGFVKPFVSYTRDKSALSSTTPGVVGHAAVTEKAWSLGATAPLSTNGLLFAEYGNSKTSFGASVNGTSVLAAGDTVGGKERAFSIGYRHNLSKRTWVQSAYGFYKQESWDRGTGFADIDTTKQRALALTVSHVF